MSKITIQVGHFMLILLSLKQATNILAGPPSVALKCGDTIAEFRGVPARHNGTCQGCPRGNCCSCDRLASEYGEGYQCVEYIRRFYAEALGVDTSTSSWPRPMNANKFFPNADQLGLMAFPNGCATLPKADDILTFSKQNRYGHVAIVTYADDEKVIIIEQNWASPFAKYVLEIMKVDGKYFVEDRDSYKVDGWLRLPELDPSIPSGISIGARYIEISRHQDGADQNSTSTLLTVTNTFNDCDVYMCTTGIRSRIDGDEFPFSSDYSLWPKCSFFDESGSTILASGSCKFTDNGPAQACMILPYGISKYRFHITLKEKIYEVLQGSPYQIRFSFDIDSHVWKNLEFRYTVPDVVPG